MSANYPEKCWYVAATSDELGDAPVGRRLLGRDVVLWRADNGGVRAFDDRCAHRGFPLSHGHVDGDRLVCAFHGCAYDGDGRCVHIPTQPEVPSGMEVRAFAVLEEPPFVWIWPGPFDTAAGSRPPRTPWIGQSGWSTFADTWHVQANYLMVHEHYLDFTYAPVVHRDDLPPGVDRLPAFDEVEVTETTVSYTRSLHDAPLADWEIKATKLDPTRAYARRESGTFASPAMHIQRWEIHTESDDYVHIRAHALTPESPTSTHVFMQASRNYAPQDEAVTAVLRSFVGELATRESGILEMVAARVGYEGWRSGFEFQADAAASRARRIVAVMVAKEAGRSAVRPGLRTSTGQTTTGQTMNHAVAQRRSPS